MTLNLGLHDRVIRMVLGFGLIAAAMLGWIGAWGWIGLLPLLTSIYGMCPAYTLFGFNTLKAHKTGNE